MIHSNAAILLTAFSLLGCGAPQRKSVSPGEAEPDLDIKYARRAFAHAQAGDWVNAVAECDRVIGIDANNVRAHSIRGLARHRIGQPSAESLGDLDYAVAHASQSEPITQVEAYYHRAIVRGELRLNQGAIDDCKQAILLAEAKGIDAAFVARSKAAGKGVTVTIGGDADEVFEHLQREAEALLKEIETGS